jgi:integrase/recombinase XerC
MAIDSKSYTLGAALSRYEIVLKGRHAPSTVKTYMSRLRVISDLLGRERLLRSISVAELETVQASYREGRSNNTVAHAVSIWKGFFGWSEQVSLLRRSPAQYLVPPRRIEPDPRPLTEEVFCALRDLMNQEKIQSNDPLTRRNATLVLFLVYTGLRRSEAARVKWENLDWSQRVLRVIGKRGKVRYVPLPLLLIPHLRQLQADSQRTYGPIFAKDQGEPLHPYTFNVIFSRWVVDRLGQHLSPHILRHTYATRMHEHGANYEEIGEILGHTSIRTTKLYVRKRIAPLLKLVDRLT